MNKGGREGESERGSVKGEREMGRGGAYLVTANAIEFMQMNVCVYLESCFLAVCDLSNILNAVLSEKCPDIYQGAEESQKR